MPKKLTQIKLDKSGAAVVVALLITGILLTIIVSLSAIFVTRLKSVSNIKNSNAAAYAADSEIEWCIYARRKNSGYPQPSLSNGATYTTQPGAASCGGGSPSITVKGAYRGITRAFDISF